MNNTPRIVIAAPYSGAGKTTLTIGLMAALTSRGLKVQPFKIGPDYIDPAFHTEVTRNNSINLDNWLLDEESLLDIFYRYAKNAEISIVEGVMGLYDGIGTMPMEGSTAGVAHMLKSPVILVLPAQGMSTTAAAIVSGLKAFGNINVAGVIINRVSSIGYYELLKEGIETHTGVKVIGWLPETNEINLKSRHLGLVQSCEIENKAHMIDHLVKLIQEHIDIDAVLKISNTAEKLDVKIKDACEDRRPIVDIAVALDEAFQFYYHENLNILRRLGARLKFFSPLKDVKLPNGIDGIYIGGGYPELYAQELENNVSLRGEIRQLAQAGLPVFAECGGYMYLHDELITLEGKAYQMVGIFKGNAVMTSKLQNFGYAQLIAEADTCLFKTGDQIKCHEFHTSNIEQGEVQKIILAKKYRKNKEIEWYTGSKQKNTFGMYPHLYFPSNIKIAQNFIDSCINLKKK